MEGHELLSNDTVNREPRDTDRFRVLGRTTMVSRSEAGSIISQEGLWIRDQLKQNQTDIEQEQGEQ